MSDGEPPAKKAAVPEKKMAEDFEPYDMDGHPHLSQEEGVSTNFGNLQLSIDSRIPSPSDVALVTCRISVL
jgi:hypothetical protein